MAVSFIMIALVKIRLNRKDKCSNSKYSIQFNKKNLSCHERGTKKKSESPMGI